jgi:hypothetical protein
MARKRLTNRVLEGIEAALNAALAGPIGDGTDFSDEDGENMDASLSWIHGQDVRDEEIATLRAKLAEAEAISVARGDWLDRIAKAVGYDASASPADVLQRIDDMREAEAERDRMRPVVEAAVKYVEALREYSERGDDEHEFKRPVWYAEAALTESVAAYLAATAVKDAFRCCGGNDEHPKFHCSDCDEHPWSGEPDPRCVADPGRCVHATAGKEGA